MRVMKAYLLKYLPKVKQDGTKMDELEIEERASDISETLQDYFD